MTAIMPAAAHFAEDHRLDVSEIQLDAGTFAPIFTGILLDWRCPHGAMAFGHLHREEWLDSTERAATIAALWLVLQEQCAACVGQSLPIVGAVVGRDGPAV